METEEEYRKKFKKETRKAAIVDFLGDRTYRYNAEFVPWLFKKLKRENKKLRRDVIVWRDMAKKAIDNTSELYKIFNEELKIDICKLLRDKNKE